MENNQDKKIADNEAGDVAIGTVVDEAQAQPAVDPRTVNNI